MDRDEQQEIKERLERFFGEVNAIGSEFHLTLGQYHEGLEEGHWKNWLTFAMHEMNCMSSSPDTQIEEQRISGMAFDEDCEEKLRIDLDDWECVEGEDTDELFEKIEELEDEEKKEQALEKFENDEYETVYCLSSSISVEENDFYDMYQEVADLFDATDVFNREDFRDMKQVAQSVDEHMNSILEGFSVESTAEEVGEFCSSVALIPRGYWGGSTETKREAMMFKNQFSHEAWETMRRIEDHEIDHDFLKICFESYKLDKTMAATVDTTKKPKLKL